MASQENSPVRDKSYDLELHKIRFEKYKYKIELLKWFIASVGLVVITMIIDYGFRDRAAGVVEMQQYDKYVNELLVLNKDVGPRRLLAQFFSKVTASDKLREGWEEYFKVVDEEYRKKADSVIAMKKVLQSLKSQDTLDPGKKVEIQQLEHTSDELHRELNAPVIVVSSVPDVGKLTAHDLAAQFERAGFDALMKKDVDGALAAFASAEKAYSKFHSVYEIHQLLFKNKRLLEDPASKEWNNVLKTIAEKYTWNIPQEYKQALEVYK